MFEDTRGFKALNRKLDKITPFSKRKTFFDKSDIDYDACETRVVASYKFDNGIEIVREAVNDRSELKERYGGGFLGIASNDWNFFYVLKDGKYIDNGREALKLIKQATCTRPARVRGSSNFVITKGNNHPGDGKMCELDVHTQPTDEEMRHQIEDLKYLNSLHKELGLESREVFLKNMPVISEKIILLDMSTKHISLLS